MLIRLRKQQGGKYCLTLNRGFTPIAIANPNRFGDVEHEYLAVADLSGSGRSHDNVENFLQPRRWDNQLKLHFRQQIDVVFLAPVNLLVAFLPAVAANLADRHSIDANVCERLFQFLQLVWLHDRFYLFHLSLRRFFSSCSQFLCIVPDRSAGDRTICAKTSFDLLFRGSFFITRETHYERGHGTKDNRQPQDKERLRIGEAGCLEQKPGQNSPGISARPND